MLAHQTSGVFDNANIDHGIIMAGHGTDWDKLVHVASIQSVHSWIKNERIELPDADMVIVDEPHCFLGGEAAMKLIQGHRERGATIIGTTATPVGLRGIFDKLLIAATTPELIKGGQLVCVHSYSPNQPDLHKIHKTAVGEYSVGDVVKVMRLQSIVGNIIDEYWRLNPRQIPTLFFGPDVPSTRWCMQQFNDAGIAATGIYDETPDDERETIRAGSKSGHWKVVGNRFVMREALDWPWIKHIILGTAFGAISTFVQTVGREMRAYPGFDHAVLQDHGGNRHRHGSPNAAIDWTLDDDDATLARKKAEKIQDGKEKEAIRCPQCGFERNYGDECPQCHYKHKKSVRMIIQEDGSLHRQVGNLTKIKRKRTEEEKRAAGMFFAAANGRGMTVGQLFYMYRKKYGEEFPNGALHGPGGAVVLPERGTMDWDRKVGALWPWAVRKKKEATQ
jgi:superfamily II DNA or RNA helicase